MIVLPASRMINLEFLKEAMSKREVRLADEEEIKSLFPDCETGATPPFGNLYNIPVYISLALTSDHSIVFNAGSHTDAIKMSCGDFKRLVNPRVALFSERIH